MSVKKKISSINKQEEETLTENSTINNNEQILKITGEEIESKLEEAKGIFDSEGICLLVACKHVFHKRCIKKWLKNKNSCPTCREVSWLRSGWDDV